MHRDLKLGLALAVLLIGSTTAFFFRNDADPDAGLPQLKNASQVDDAVAERDVAPYLGAQVSSLPTDAIATSPWSKPAFLGNAVAAVRNAAATPDPIQLVMEDIVEPVRAAHGDFVRAVPEAPQLDAEGLPIHVVQSGDTLSGISAKYLGGIARFDEIYELNRDQLSGPHALKIGMKLRLPVSGKTTTPAPPESNSSFLAVTQTKTVEAAEDPVDTPAPNATSSEDSEVAAAAEERAPSAEPATEPPAAKLFTPAKRTPFVPSRYRAPKASR